MSSRALFALALLAAAPAGAQDAPAPFTMTFGFARETLDAAAIETVTSAARAFALSGAETASVAGHTDTVGDPRVNQALSARRAALVRRELLVRGVPSAALETAALGERELAVETPDNTRARANRRVEVAVIGPGARPAPDPLAPYAFRLPRQAPQD